MNPTKIVIVGAGFGGVSAAKALRKTSAEVTLIDRTNHHLFQPLLYQVATAVLNPSQIGWPIRDIFQNQKNTTVILGEVTGIDKEQKCVLVSNADRQGVTVPYDYLIVATGSTHSYFGHNEYAAHAPGLKSVADALAARNKVLLAFERAEAEVDPTHHRDLLTFVLVGAGPTGVEMSGALAMLVRTALKSEFRRINPCSARIVLVDAGPRVLAQFSEKLSKAAAQQLERLGVELRLGHRVDHIDADGVVVAGERIASKTVIWTAGVEPSPAGKWLNAETDRAGRVRVQKDLTLPGHPEILVIGDTASLDQHGKPLPGVAQVAMQQGRYAAKVIHSRLSGSSPPRPFSYFDKGNMAVVGRGFAVLHSGKVQASGFGAWLTWAGVHLQYLANTSVRLSVLLQWIWTFLTGKRGAGLIVNYHKPEPLEPAERIAPKRALAGD